MWKLLGEALQWITKEIINATTAYIEFEHEVKKGFREMGYNGQQLHNITKGLLVDTRKWGLEYGVTKEQLFEIQKGLTQISKTTTQMSSETKEVYIGLSKLVGTDTAVKSAEAMQKFGMHAKTSAAWIGKGVIQAKALGLNSKEFTEQMSQSIGLMHKMNFKNGISGLQKMVGLATRLGTSVDTLTKHIDIDGGAFSDIEKSIENAAQLQRLGGSFAANFGNPMEVMAEGMFDAESAAERLSKTLEGKAVFNRATGQADMSWYNSKQLGIAAQALGIDPSEARSIAKRSAMGNAIESDLDSKKSMFSAEELDAIKNLAEYDAKSQKFQISYVDKHGNTQTTDIQNLTREQLDEAIALTDAEKNVDRNVATIAGQVTDIAKAIKGTAKETTSAQERIEGGQDAYQSLKIDMLGLDGAVDKANSAAGGFGGFLAHPWETIKGWFGHAEGGIVKPSPIGIEGVSKFATGGIAEQNVSKFANGGTVEQKSPISNSGNIVGSTIPKFADGGTVELQPTSIKNVSKFADGGAIEQKPPKFADGGISPLLVGGSSYVGDKVLARVNSGEMILNKTQQANLFKMLNKTQQVNRFVGSTVKGMINPFSLLSNNSRAGRLGRNVLRRQGPEGVKIAESIEKIANKISAVKGNISNVASAPGRMVSKGVQAISQSNNPVVKALSNTGKLITNEAKVVGGDILKAGKFITKPFSATGRVLGNAGKVLNASAKTLTKPVIEAGKKTVSQVSSKVANSALGRVGGKVVGKLGKGGTLASVIEAGVGLWKAGSAVADYSKMATAIEKSDYSKKEKKEMLRKAQDERNEAVGSGVGRAAGAVAATVAVNAIPVVGQFLAGSGLAAMAGGWIGDKLGGLIGKNVNKAKDFLFGKDNTLDEEEQAQLDYEETKLGPSDATGEQLMEEAAHATLGIHDLLISIWHKMNGKLSNGEEVDKGLFGNIASGISSVAKGALSIATSPMRGAIGIARSIFGGSKKESTEETVETLSEYQSTMLEKVTSISDNIEGYVTGSGNPESNKSGGLLRAVTSGLGLSYGLGLGGLFTAKNVVSEFFNKSEGSSGNVIPDLEELRKQYSIAENIEPEPLGSNNTNFKEEKTSSTSINNYNATDTVKLEVSGSIKLDAGGINTKEIDLSKLLENRDIQEKIINFVVTRLDSVNGRVNANNRNYQIKTAGKV